MTSNELPAAPRPLGREDLAACLALATDRAWRDDDVQWRFLLEVGDAFGIDDPAGGLAGTVIVTRYEPGLAVIGMLLVATRHGRRGLGTRLLRHALDHAAGRTVFLYATPQGRPLYERLGFRPAGLITKHTGAYRRAPGGAAGGRAGIRIRPPAPADGAGVLRLDRAVFGADRGAVLAGLATFAEKVVVAEDGNGLAGHAAAWRRSHGVLMIGPVVARDDAVARALLDALAPAPGQPVRLDLSSGHAGLSEWASHRGLSAAPPDPLMVHRGGQLPGRRDQLCAPLLQALG